MITGCSKLCYMIDIGVDIERGSIDLNTIKLNVDLFSWDKEIKSYL